MSNISKVVVITGAGSGMGRATALMLAARGASVVLGGRRNEALAAVAGEIGAAGGRAVYRAADVTSRASVEDLVAEGCRAFGRVDVIVNNAGIAPLSRFDALRVDEWDAMIDVNLRGVLHGIAAVLPIFARQQSGHVITIVSTAGLRIVPTMGVYAATKNAVRTVMEALRQEAGPHLRVTEISPGMTQSDFLTSITDATLRREMESQAASLAMPAEAVARAVCFAIEQPAEVEIGSLVIRPTAQG